jgi:membrane protease YdiL (CAAX protease family)
MGVLVVWLMLNAPWQEELIFRHYLVPRLSAIGGLRSKWTMVLAVGGTAAIFALGHGGHLDPAWPKLVQTFVWGLMLGSVRVWLGTGYAVGLHLLFNLSAPLMAPFVM